MVVRGEGSCRAMGEKGEGMRYKLAAIKTAVGVIKCSLGNTGNNIVITGVLWVRDLLG